jgi:WD40 repeat protein
MECWVFSPEGGEPKRQANPPELRGLSFSPDGKYVATTSQTQRAQVWALENFLPGRKP